VTWRSILGNTGTEADEADVEFTINMIDIREKANPANDYAGELQLKGTYRITDQWSHAGPGTMQDIDFLTTVPCATTGSTSIGSTCSVLTTTDAILPNTIREGKRSIWDIEQALIFDGGSDGDVDTPSGNTVFATPGVFAP
jgi:hypothetical protein